MILSLKCINAEASDSLLRDNIQLRRVRESGAFKNGAIFLAFCLTLQYHWAKAISIAALIPLANCDWVAWNSWHEIFCCFALMLNQFCICMNNNRSLQTTARMLNAASTRTVPMVGAYATWDLTEMPQRYVSCVYLLLVSVSGWMQNEFALRAQLISI